MRELRIGVDATCLANPRGYGRFAREILAILLKRTGVKFILFVDERSAPFARKLSEGSTADVIVVRQQTSPTLAAAAGSSRSPTDMFRFTRAVWSARTDAFFSPTVYTYFPLPPGLPALICFHDAIADRFPDLTFPNRKARIFWRFKTSLALRQARLVLTVSDYAARDIAEWFHLDPRRIRVAEEAPAAAYTPPETTDSIRRAAAAAGLPDLARWFIYVGGFNPHKHVDVLVRAHSRVAEERTDPPHLLLVGATGSDVFHRSEHRILAEIERCGTAPLVHWTGFVPDDELRFLVGGALALVLPSEREGFGLPAVEAAACGTPVIATRESPLPQLLKDGGFFVAPRDEDALVTGMQALLDTPALRAALGERALAAARRLSWERAARSTWDAIQEIVA